MTDRPILFSGPMVRTLLDCRKSQTRRVLKPQPEFRGGAGDWSDPEEWGWEDEDGAPISVLDIRPNGFARGDRCWVREAHALVPRTAYRGSVGTGTIQQIEHPTDGYTAAVFREGFDRSGSPPWRPSIHMPRWASRLTLTVTDVRVQRLQEISEADALAEGIERMKSGRGYYDHTVSKAMVRAGIWHRRASEAFASLWDSLNASRGFGWDANPWVVALTFSVEQRNIDKVA